MNNNTISDMQHPINSEFDAFSTAQDVIKGVDLSGKVAIITGGYSGIGLETAKALHSAGASIIIPARDVNNARQVFKDVDNRVEIYEMDLTESASIYTFVEKFLVTGRPLDLLINNAGVMATPLTRDKRGYEWQFSTNHLGHFELTARLWPGLKKSKSARVISVSSFGHRFSNVIFDDPNFKNNTYNKWLAYGQSKTANILFALELDKRSKQHHVRAFSLHPGRILDTNLNKFLTTEDLQQMGAVDNDNNRKNDPANPLKTIQQGASTTTWCATSPTLAEHGGVYCANCNIAELMKIDPANAENIKDASGLSGVLPYAVDFNNAAKLWGLSEELVGIKFNTI